MLTPERLQATRVIAILQTIERRKVGGITSESGRKILGKQLATSILNNLPTKVGTYTHSEQMSYITATRGEGETWNAIQAQEWADSKLSIEENRELRQF